MKPVILLLLFVLSVFQLSAQSRPDSISMKKGLSPQFMQNGMRIMPRDLVKITKSNPEATAEMKKANSNNTIASILGSTGGFLIGWPLGTALGGGEPNWSMAGVGAGILAVSIPFSTAFTRHAKNAINIYNSSPKATGMKPLDFKLQSTGNGVALKLTF